VKHRWILIYLLSLILTVGIATDVVAQKSGKSKPKGAVEEILEVKVVPFDSLSSVLPELRSYDTPPKGVNVARIQITSNNSNGFKVVMTSERKGMLMRQEEGRSPPNPEEGDFISYKLDLNRGKGGVLGCAIPVVTQRRGLDLKIERTISFDTDVKNATIGAEFDIMMHTQKKPGLFRGVYLDIITFIISDV